MMERNWIFVCLQCNIFQRFSSSIAFWQLEPLVVGSRSSFWRVTNICNGELTTLSVTGHSMCKISHQEVDEKLILCESGPKGGDVQIAHAALSGLHLVSVAVRLNH